MKFQLLEELGAYEYMTLFCLNYALSPPYISRSSVQLPLTSFNQRVHENKHVTQDSDFWIYIGT
jgi:hypothetical protein